jgi:hypothetical protein
MADKRKREITKTPADAEALAGRRKNNYWTQIPLITPIYFRLIFGIV